MDRPDQLTPVPDPLGRRHDANKPWLAAPGGHRRRNARCLARLLFRGATNDQAADQCGPIRHRCYGRKRRFPSPPFGSRKLAEKRRQRRDIRSVRGLIPAAAEFGDARLAEADQISGGRLTTFSFVDLLACEPNRILR